MIDSKILLLLISELYTRLINAEIELVELRALVAQKPPEAASGDPE